MDGKRETRWLSDQPDDDDEDDDDTDTDDEDDEEEDEGEDAVGDGFSER